MTQTLINNNHQLRSSLPNSNSKRDKKEEENLIINKSSSLRNHSLPNRSLLGANPVPDMMQDSKDSEVVRKVLDLTLRE